MTGRSPLRKAAAGSIIAFFAVLVLAADQFTKYLAITFLPPEEPVHVIGDFLIFYLVRNPGAAFSMGESVTWLFTIALVVVAGIVVWLAATRVRSRLWAVVLGLLLGGVLGNLTDRLFRPPAFAVGHVVDFINTPWLMPAIYNVADMFIVTMMIGVALLVLSGVQLDGHRERKHLSDDVVDTGEETILGADGDEVPPGGGVAGQFSAEFPGADPYEGVPADEVGLPPLSEAEQDAVAREADRIAEDPDSRRDL